jgi:hypothetical protein
MEMERSEVDIRARREEVAPAHFYSILSIREMQ